MLGKILFAGSISILNAIFKLYFRVQTATDRYMVAASCPKRKESSSKTSRSSDKKKNEKRRKHRDREREKREKYPSCVDGAKYYPKAVPASEGDKRTNSKSKFS